ncbi:CoA transferase [Nocardia sp. NPDC052278]|uniref:CoA transferase n=1 Tax=unclassified Nocardia TaxID=2637762 RepID=UPI0036AC746C
MPEGMLSWLGAAVVCDAQPTGEPEQWAASGLMALTGLRDGVPLAAPGQVASAVEGALLAIRLLARVCGREVELPDARLLSERAAYAGLHRDAPRSPGGSFRILRAADDWLGVNLARSSDIELLPAWLEEPDPVLDHAVAQRSAVELAATARVLGLPVAVLGGKPDEQLIARGQCEGVHPFKLTGRSRSDQWTLPPTVVVDLSSLWAGPLCGHLLNALGARVIKVESIHRLDGARGGPRRFYDLLHAGQESVAIDFTTVAGRAVLAQLIDIADVVIEASRPRALEQLGIHAEEVLSRGTDKCWVSITGYGRVGPWSNAVGFGDDAAFAAGLIAFDPETGIPAPCGDAIADPVTGVNAALVALACRMSGGWWLADLAMREQVAAALETPSEPDRAVEAADPPARSPRGTAPASGVDTTRVLAEFGIGPK